MKNNLIDEYASYDTIKQFDSLPGRVFLDTNALQYLQDFGEYIFDNYNELPRKNVLCVVKQLSPRMIGYIPKLRHWH